VTPPDAGSVKFSILPTIGGVATRQAYTLTFTTVTPQTYTFTMPGDATSGVTFTYYISGDDERFYATPAPSIYTFIGATQTPFTVRLSSANVTGDSNVQLTVSTTRVPTRSVTLTITPASSTSNDALPVSTQPFVFTFTPSTGIVPQMVSYAIPNGIGEISFTTRVSGDDAAYYSLPTISPLKVIPQTTRIMASGVPPTVYVNQTFAYTLQLVSPPRKNVVLTISGSNLATVTPNVIQWNAGDVSARTVIVRAAPGGSFALFYTLGGADAALYLPPTSPAITTTPLGVVSVNNLPSFISAGATMSFTIGLSRAPSSPLSVGVTPVINGVSVASLRSSVLFTSDAPQFVSVFIPTGYVGTLSLFIQLQGTDASFYVISPFSQVAIRATSS